jgi:hypothetical protein
MCHQELTRNNQVLTSKSCDIQYPWFRPYVQSLHLPKISIPFLVDGVLCHAIATRPCLPIFQGDLVEGADFFFSLWQVKLWIKILDGIKESGGWFALVNGDLFSFIFLTTMIISKGPYKICTDIGSKLFYSHMFNKLPRLDVRVTKARMSNKIDW